MRGTLNPWQMNVFNKSLNSGEFFRLVDEVKCSLLEVPVGFSLFFALFRQESLLL